MKTKNILIISTLIILLAFILLLFFKKDENNKEYNLGVILPLTGELSAHAKEGLLGIKLAINKFNEKGGIEGTKIRLVVEDDKLSPVVGLTAFQKLITINKTNIVLGGFTSPVAMAIAPDANKKRIILFSPFASIPSLTSENGYVFRNWPSDNYDAIILANFCISKLNKKEYSVLYPINDNGVSLSNLFKEKINELGGTINIFEGYQTDKSDFKVELKKVKSAKSQVLFIPAYYEDIAKIMRQSYEIGLKIIFVATSVAENYKLIDLAGEAVEGLIYSKTAINEDDSVYNEFEESFINSNNYKAWYRSYAVLRCDKYNYPCPNPCK